MTRPSLRRSPMLESLEIRQVLSGINPTADQQYALELINLVRTNPAEAATRITANLSPAVQSTLTHFGLTTSSLVQKLDSAASQPPLAFSASLSASAQTQSQYEADNAVQTHQGSGQSSMGDRIASSGYSNAISLGENTYAYAQSIDEAMQSFLFDWGVADDGHYNNLLQPGTSPQDSYKDVGIGLVSTSKQGIGPLVITQDFGNQQNEGPQILGVVFNDPNHSGFYAPGQGQSGVTIDALNLATNQTFETQSTDSGGYQMQVSPNAYYKVTATQNGQVISSQQIYVKGVNEKVDFSQVATPTQSQTTTSPTPVPAPITPSSSTPDQSQTQQTSTPAPAPTPAPTPTPAPAPAPIQPPAQQAPPEAPPVVTPSAPSQPSWLAYWSRWTAKNSSAH